MNRLSKPKHRATYPMNTLIIITDFMTSAMASTMKSNTTQTFYTNYLIPASQMVNNTYMMAQEYRMPLTFMVNSFMENVTATLTKIQQNQDLSFLMAYLMVIFMTAMMIQCMAPQRMVRVEVEDILQDSMINRRNLNEKNWNDYEMHTMMRRSMRPKVFYMLA